MGTPEEANYKKYGMITGVIDRIIISNPIDKVSPGDKENVVMSPDNTNSDSSHAWVSMSPELASQNVRRIYNISN
jgi:hypothetical protein